MIYARALYVASTRMHTERFYAYANKCPFTITSQPKIVKIVIPFVCVTCNGDDLVDDAEIQNFSAASNQTMNSYQKPY